MRAFLAIEIPKEVKEKLSSLQKELRDILICNFVKELNFHVTLKFIGEVDDKDVDKIKSKCSEIADGLKPFKVSIENVGAFPSDNSARVIWAQIITGQIEVQRLHDTLDKEVKFGKVDPRKYDHITLVRVKSITDKSALNQFFIKNKSKIFGSFDVKEFKLIKSTLRRTGPIYEEIANFNLG